MPKLAYNVVYADLLRQIEGGVIVPGDRLPSENELVKRYGVSRMTIRKVLRLLAEEGRLDSRAGVGWEVLGAERPEPAGRNVWRIGVDRLPFYSARSYRDRILQGIQEAAEGRNVTLLYNDYWKPELRRADAPDALILQHPKELEAVEEFCDWEKPVCFINRRPANPGFSCLSVDYVQEAKRAVEYLLRIGHRRIACLALSSNNYASQQRKKGWRRAFSDNGLIPPKELVFFAGNKTDISEMLLQHRPTAVFLTFASLLSSFLLSAERAKLRILEDLSMICFDDLSDIPYVGFPVSHIRMPLATMGHQALEHIVERLEKPETPPLHRMFEADLAINSSCRALTPIF